MPVYSSERKAAVMRKLLPPENRSVASVSREEGITEQTLYNWVKEVKRHGVAVPGSRKKTSEDWSGEAKLSVVIETSGFNEAERNEYCRRKGLYPEQIEQWRQACIEGAGESERNKSAERTALKNTQMEVKKLQKELRRKDKALAESAALLILQKKFQALWEDEDQ